MNVSSKQEVSLVNSKGNEKPNDEMAKAVWSLLQHKSVKLGYKDILKMRLVCKDWNEVILSSKDIAKRTAVIMPRYVEVPKSLLDKYNESTDEEEKAELNKKMNEIDKYKMVDSLIKSFKYSYLVELYLSREDFYRGPNSSIPTYWP